MNIGAITCVLAVLSVPCAAQSTRVSASAMQEYVAADLVWSRVALPENLHADGVMRQLLEAMLERSPTFRRQCQRVGNDLRLTVHLNAIGALWTRGARALSDIVRGPRAMKVEIYLARAGDPVEMIAHELEHVIEQLDEVNLSARAQHPDSGVRRTLASEATFETRRASETGLKVAREVRESLRGD